MTCTTTQITEAKARLARMAEASQGNPFPLAVVLQEYIVELESAGLAALEHVVELREAWRTGAIVEAQYAGGGRANRNVAVECVLRNALRQIT